MSSHVSSYAPARRTGASSTTERVRYLAAVAAAVTAVLYLLIGLEVLWVGDSKSGEDPGLLGFGLSVGAAFLVAAGLLAVVNRRWVWLAVGLLQLVVIVGYVAMAGIREPAFAPWGLVVKAVQVVILTAVAYLVIRGPQPARRTL